MPYDDGNRRANGRRARHKLERRCGALITCLSLAITQPAFATKRHTVIAGIDKSAKSIGADLDRMFPCSRRLRECAWSYDLPSTTSRSPVFRIEAAPEIYRVDDGRKFRLEPNPMYGKFIRYMFPRWRKSDAWLAHSLEVVRHSLCSPMAHIGDAWVIVRGGIEVLGYIRAQMIITRDPHEVASWKKLDEIFCNGPLVVQEIR